MNLIICHTPLQVLIAAEIIKMYPNEKFHGVMIYTIKNEKYEYYTSKLSLMCHKCTSFYLDTLSSWKKLFILIQLKLFFLHKEYDRVFIANIANLFFHLIYSTISKNNKGILLFTFDDGSANFSIGYKEKIISDDTTEDTNKKIIRFLFKIDINTLGILQKIQNHFTFYPNLANFIQPSKNIRISLFTSNIKKSLVNHNTVSVLDIFIGQPLYEITTLFASKNEYYNKVNELLSHFNIKYYMPHPREDLSFLNDNIQIIQTPLICENFIINYINNTNGQININLYSFYSTSILLLQNINNISVVAIRPMKNLPSDIEELYSLFEKLGIKIINKY